ncbi:MAG TPA: serpin family protein [Labilithrix sp.]|nr:serpin family protein [Labilithrix sp.]
MFQTRVLPWVPLALGVVACGEGSSSGPASSPPKAVDPAAVTTATLDPPAQAPEATSAAKTRTAEDLTASTEELTTDIRNANAFTAKLLARTKKGENAMVSGTSMRHALATTYLGARGATASEMATALSLDKDAKTAAHLARAELAAWQDARGNAELNIASRLWVDDDYQLQPDFTKIALSGFGAAPATVDYGKSEEARKTINGWVAQQTKDKIPELLPQGSIDGRTQLVVTNAIWFKGRWEFPFPKTATKDEAFKLDAQKSVTTPLMHLTDSFRIATLPGLKVLELRYADSQLAMLVALPDEPEPSAIAKLEAALGPETFAKWTAALATARVDVTLPRFTFRGGGSMNSTLQDLGMKTAFSEKADFSGIAAPRAGEPLYMSQVVHQTWVAVDELGTEAAAATGATMRTTSVVTGPVVEFRADHPFLFFVSDVKQGRVLFAGRVLNPKAS